jgi:hypothetical protein
MKRAMNRLPRLLAPTTLICALLAALAFATTAAAETRIGEATSFVDGAIEPEGDIVRARAEYDSTAGTLSVKVTTAAAPGENPEVALIAGLATPKTCTFEATQGSEEAFPSFQINAPYGPVVPVAFAIGSKQELEEAFPIPGVATKSVEGSVTTLGAQSEKAVNQPYSCVLVGVLKQGTSEPLDYVLFPLLSQTIKPPSNSTETETHTASITPSVPAALAIPDSKPVTAKAGKWTKVKVKVANTGGTTVGPIAFKAKAPAGVVVKPGSPKLPALLGGQTWTINLQVKLTDKAKAKSTITLTGTAGALTATGSVVVKSAS